VGEIYVFKADGDIVWMITANGRYKATQILKVPEARLARFNFRRIHRNALVNVDHVRKMCPLSSQRWLITVDNDLEFVARQRLAGCVSELLQW
jgi:DNA-binding LytR/AlgR family response regulator